MGGRRQEKGVGAISYEAVFFDFDGVLAESSEIKTNAFKALYREYGDETVARVVAHHQAHAGLSRLIKIRECHKRFLGVDLTEEALAALGRRYTEQVEAAVVECPWVPGAREFLDAHEDSLKYFVVSGTPHAEMLRIVEARDMAGHFVSVHGSPPLKPVTVIDLMEKHELARERCLFIGDAMTDYDAARETGVDFIGRVPEGGESPFPAGTRTISDFTELSLS